MNSDDGNLDRELDAALLQYGAAEPRAGLEDRVLAHLRAQARMQLQTASAWGWWRYSALAAATAIVIVITLFLVPRAGRRQTVESGHRRPSIGSQDTSNVTKADVKRPFAAKHFVAPRRPLRPRAASGPRLDQFPSPQPLSDQEKSLQSYIAEYPEHAALIARARTEALQRDLAEEAASAGTTAKDSSQ